MSFRIYAYALFHSSLSPKLSTMAQNHFPIPGVASNATQSVGDILTEMFSGNSPLAKGYRAHFAAKSLAEEGGAGL